jgi:regulation of enolase protein 1 (concanavalin A-like superfamily)
MRSRHHCRNHTAGMLRIAGLCLVIAASASAKDQTVKGWSAPFGSADIGNPSIHGSTTATQGGLQVLAGGKDIWGNSDEFHFTYQKQTGDFDVMVRVESLTAPQLYTRAGIMAREDLSADSRHVFFLVFPDNRPRHANTSAYEYQYRETKGGGSAGIYPPQSDGPPAFPVAYPHAWLRLRRTGDQFTGFVSSDGKSWKEYGSRSLDLPATLYLGLAVTSHLADASATARFADVRVQK